MNDDEKAAEEHAIKAHGSHPNDEDERRNARYDFLAGIQHERAKHGWVSVKDRLPEDNELVVVLLVDRLKLNHRQPSVYFGRKQGELWVEALDHCDVGWISPTHWMPLPEPPMFFYSEQGAQEKLISLKNHGWQIVPVKIVKMEAPNEKD